MPKKNLEVSYSKETLRTTLNGMSYDEEPNYVKYLK